MQDAANPCTISFHHLNTESVVGILYYQLNTQYVYSHYSTYKQFRIYGKYAKLHKIEPISTNFRQKPKNIRS